jgi:DNA-directed RNA polymerase subunit RPC12/RpoP
MEFQDKVLKCIDCGSDFIFTAGEQLFFHDKQFKNEPKRCKACKTKRVSVLGAPPAPGQNYRYTKVETPGAHTWMVWRRNLIGFTQMIFK